MAASGESARAFVVMAEIVAPYGVHGSIKLKSFTDRPGALRRYRTWWLQKPPRVDWVAMTVAEVREHSGLLVAQLSGVDSRESAMQWRGARVGVPRDELPPAADGEIYYADLVGLVVVNRAGLRLGEVKAVDDFGAHPLLRVEAEDGTRRLIPFVAAYVDGVDRAAKRIDVDWEADY
jgi:16S rRNA processing protein RimM